MEECTHESDHELVFRVQRGETSAYDELMLRYQDSIAAQMRRFSPSTEVVEDLTQTTFVRAYQGLGSYHPTAPFVNWLRIIANRVGYEHWRQEARRVKCVPYHGNENVAAEERDDAAETFEKYHELTRVMEKLRPAERQTLMLMYVDGLSLAEIADSMGWNLAMTKMRAYRARMKLRKILQAKETLTGMSKQEDCHG